jgi:2'-5' RNA ligase
MPGLVSLLPQPYYDQTIAFWDELEANFGLKGIRITPLPHFSWQVGEEYAEESVLKAMEAIAEDTKPFEVRVKGVESFISENPVVFLKVLKNPALLLLHLRIWLKFLPLSSGLSMLYSPPLRSPHISLAYQDLNIEQMKDVLTFMRAKQVDWQFTVDNLTYICEPVGEVGQVTHQVKFLG